MPEEERDSRPTTVRFDLGLRERIERVASTEDRSVNWMVNKLLREALDAREGGPRVQDDW